MTFACPSMDHTWRAGDRVLLTVEGNRRRTYTICSVKPVAQRFDVLAVAHPEGPGGRLVREMLVGEPIVVFGPKPDLDVRTLGASQIVLLGDETTVGLFEAVRGELRGRPSVRGAVEYGVGVGLPRCSLPALQGVDTTRRDAGHPGASLRAWVEDNITDERHTVFFVNGHGAAVRALRLQLLAMGVEGAAIRSRAYWGRS